LKWYRNCSSVDNTGAAAVFDDTETVGVVGHEPRIMALTEIEEIGDRCPIAIHTENAIRQNQAVSMGVAVLCQESS
jgi:phosphohistidine phosphatase SixA